MPELSANWLNVGLKEIERATESWGTGLKESYASHSAGDVRQSTKESSETSENVGADRR